MRVIRIIAGASAESGIPTRLRILIAVFVIATFTQYANAQSRQLNDLSGTRILVKQIYTSQIGIREKGTNSGPQVDQYLKYVGLLKGNPWCAAFVCWVFGQAGVANPKTGWSPTLFGERYVIWGRDQRTKSKEQRLPKSESSINYQESRLSQYVLQAYAASPTTNNQQPTTNNQQLTSPSPGDIFALYFPEKNRIAHTGFIDQWDGTWMVSVEGNTNVSGSREGDGVYRKRRLVRTVYKVSRFIGGGL